MHANFFERNKKKVSNNVIRLNKIQNDLKSIARQLNKHHALKPRSNDGVSMSQRKSYKLLQSHSHSHSH